MKDQRKSEIKVGIMTLAGIIIFLWILGWAKNFSFTSHDKSLNLLFENAAGLEVGDNVTINGVRKGYVEAMTVKQQQVDVKINLDLDADLRQDAKFSISMLDLMGGKKIDINPGKSSKQIDYGKTYIGSFYADIPAVLAMVGSMQGDLTKIISEVNTTLSSMNSYLSDKKMENNIKSSIDNLASLTQKLNLMIDENRSNVNKLSGNAVQLTEDAKSFIKQNKNSIEKSMTDLQSLIKESELMIKKVNGIIDETTNKQNAVGKLLYDDKVINDLKESLQQVKELTKILTDQLKEKGLKVDAKVRLF
ncbi:MAG: MlaD family protein [Bacteroidota bacterium]|nr:MlaD family protein [Bacteroidota bacterium]